MKLALPTCAFLGPKVSQTDCKVCGGSPVSIDLHECKKLKTECSVERVVGDGKPCCRTCFEYTVVSHPPRELLPGIPDPLPDPRLPHYPDGWACLPEVKRVHVRALQKFTKQTYPAPNKCEGNGILFIGGGRWWPMLNVAVRMARRVTDLPIQIWYNGTQEPVYPEDLQDLPNITYYDQTQVLPKPRITGGWEGKTLALLSCGLRRVLYLDADAYLINNPQGIFNLLSEENPFIYYQDLANFDEATGWSWFGIQSHVGNRIPCIQGGQYFIDLLHFRKELIIAHWLDQHSDYSYHFPGIADQNHNYGDQNQYRVALAYTRGKYLCLGRAPWEHPAFICPYNGMPLIVHRCQGKWWGNTEDKRTPYLPGDDIAWGFLQNYLIGNGTSEDIFTRLAQRRLIPQDLSEIRDKYIQDINFLHRICGANSVCDVGCGDGYITMRIQADMVVGVDCKATHIENLRSKFFKKEWLHVDVLTDERELLPKTDIYLLRNVLSYWPSQEIIKFLQFVLKEKMCKYLIITDDLNQTQNPRNSKLGERCGLSPATYPLNVFKFRKMFDNSLILEVK